MTTPRLIHRELSRLNDEDSQAIYDLLISTRGTQLRHGNRLDELVELMAEHATKLDEILALLRERG